MLDTPKSGWTTITIGDWTDDASHLCDVPTMLLEAIEAVSRTNKVQCVKLESPRGENTIVFDIDVTYIIYNDEDDVGFINEYLDITELAAELIGDIRRDIDAWAAWGFNTPEQIDERRKLFEELCGIIEGRM